MGKSCGLEISVAHISFIVHALVYIGMEANCTIMPNTSSTYISLNECTIAIYNQMKKQISSKYVNRKAHTDFSNKNYNSGRLQLIN